MGEVVEGLVRLGQRIWMDLGADRHSGCSLQEFLAILSRQVGDGADLPLHPEEVVRKRWDVAHVDGGAKIKAASSGSGGGVSESPAHSAPRLRAKACFLVSPGEVKAKTRRPWKRATCAMMCAESPKPYRPIRCASPASRSAR